MASQNGLIDDYADVDGLKVPQAAASTATTNAATTAQAPTATAATFTPGEATTATTAPDALVENRVKGIIDQNSPLQQQSEARSLQRAAQRGLVNSSMAVTAGQAALYDAALPIAQQDASTVAAQGRANQDAKNQFGLANMQEQNQTSRFNTAETNKSDQFNTAEANTTARLNTTEANKASLANAEMTNQMAAQNAKTQNDALMQQRDNQNKLALQTMDSQTRTNLVNIEANYKTLMQASQSASDMYSQTLQAISNIQNNKDLDAASRNYLIDQQTKLLQNGLNLIGSVNNLNMSQLLDFSGITNGAAPARPREQIPEAPPQSRDDFIRDLNTGGGE